MRQLVLQCAAASQGGGSPAPHSRHLTWRQARHFASLANACSNEKGAAAAAAAGAFAKRAQDSAAPATAATACSFVAVSAPAAACATAVSATRPGALASADSIGVAPLELSSGDSHVPPVESTAAASAATIGSALAWSSAPRSFLAPVFCGAMVPGAAEVGSGVDIIGGSSSGGGSSGGDDKMTTAPRNRGLDESRGGLR